MMEERRGEGSGMERAGRGGAGEMRGGSQLRSPEPGSGVEVGQGGKVPGR